MELSKLIREDVAVVVERRHSEATVPPSDEAHGRRIAEQVRQRLRGAEQPPGHKIGAELRLEE